MCISVADWPRLGPAIREYYASFTMTTNHLSAMYTTTISSPIIAALHAVRAFVAPSMDCVTGPTADQAGEPFELGRIEPTRDPALFRGPAIGDRLIGTEYLVPTFVHVPEYLLGPREVEQGGAQNDPTRIGRREVGDAQQVGPDGTAGGLISGQGE